MLQHGKGCQVEARVHRPVELYNLPVLHLQSWTEVVPTGAVLPGGHGVHCFDEKPSLKESRSHFSHWAPEPILGISCCNQKQHSLCSLCGISSTVKSLSFGNLQLRSLGFPRSYSSLESSQESRHTTSPLQTFPVRSESKC